MRRGDREINDTESIINIIRKCDVCRLALNDDGFPYILPLNFGMRIESDKIVLYFHGAKEGRKYELMKKDNRASFEMDCSHKLVTSGGMCTMEYESVIGRGIIEIVQDEEKYDALNILMNHYHYNKEFIKINDTVIPNMNLFKLTVEEVTGKANISG